MSYLQDNGNSRGSGGPGVYVLVALLALILYFFSAQILNGGFNLLSSVAGAIWRLDSEAIDGRDDFFALIKSKQQLVAENKELKEKLSNTELKLETLALVQKDNDDLMSELGREVVSHSSSSVARVLAGPNLPPYESLVLDVGRHQGVSVGDRVICEPNILLGEIYQVSDGESKVKLYSSSGTNVDVFMNNPEPTHIVAVGYGGGNFSVELPSDVYVEKGMRLVAPGDEMYTIGSIDYIEKDPVTSVQKILVRYPVNIKNLKFVHVIKGAVSKYLE